MAATVELPRRPLPAGFHRCEGCPGGPAVDPALARAQEANDCIVRCLQSCAAAAAAGGAPRLRSPAEWGACRTKLEEQGLIDPADAAILEECPLGHPEALDIGVEGAGLDASGFQLWLCRRLWGDALRQFDAEAEAFRGAVHDVNAHVTRKGIDKLSKDELYTYQILLGEYEHSVADVLRSTLRKAKAAEQAVGGPVEPDPDPVAAAPPPPPPPAEEAATPADPEEAQEAEPGPLPTTPEEFQWTRGPEIERRLRDLQVPGVAFPPGAHAVERTEWGTRRLLATAVTTGEEVEVLEVPWDVAPEHADHAALVTHRLEALKQLALSPYFPDYLGCDFSSYAGVAMHFLQRRQGISLRRLLAEVGPLQEQDPLLRHWAREILLALRDYLYQCCQELTEDITLAHVFVHQEGSRVLLQGLPFGDRRGALAEDLPEYGPQLKWRNTFEVLEARLVSMFGGMLLEMLSGQPSAGAPRGPLGPAVESLSPGMRSLLLQALNARDSLDFRLGQLPVRACGPAAAAAPEADAETTVTTTDYAARFVGLSGGLVAAGLDEHADPEQYWLWWAAPARREDIPPIRPNLERCVDAGTSAAKAYWDEKLEEEAKKEEPPPAPDLRWQPNAELATLQALLDNPVLRRPATGLVELMEAWDALSSAYRGARSRG